ncbi:MAG: hypothetical protein HOE53_03340 [Candidatus Magasanikbacteria bacterium]|jgi:signal transduction histidine kinase|nr:hypothetical protein [Candidatus Magasanikbacteria bacterium]
MQEGLSLNYFSISALINAMTSLGLGIFILLTNRQQRVARYLVYFCFAVAAWSIPYFLWQISDTAAMAYFWSRMLMFGAIFTSIAYFHLVLVFLKKENVEVHRIMFAIFYFFVFFFTIANFTPYFVAGVAPKMGFEFWPVPGPLYSFFLLGFFAHVTYASILLFRKYKKAKGIQKKQILLLLIGIGLAFVGGSTNYFLWYNIPIAPWGNGLVAVYVLLTAYSIMKYGFLSFKVVAAQIFTGLLIMTGLMDLVTARTTGQLIGSVVSLFAVSVFGLMLVRSVVGEVTKREELDRLAKKLNRLNVKLKQLDRQKTEFLSIASHQLRTPLSIMKGYIELIEDGAYGKITRKTKHILDEMDESNERLVKLVDSFLNISRIEQGRTKYSFETLSMRDLISNVVHELHDRAEGKGLKLIWKMPKTKLMTYMDEEKVRHVIFNFIDNAIKYTPTGKVRVFVTQEHKGMKFSVKDSGIGFDPIDQPNFFHKFYRGKNVEGENVNGTGLGIYVCKQFAEAHGGKVWAKSAGKGKGSDFGFWIPDHRTSVHKRKEKEGRSKKQQVVNQYSTK